MAAVSSGENRKLISASSARAHTRSNNRNSSFNFNFPGAGVGVGVGGGLLIKLLLIGLVGLLAWAYQSAQPPPPNICGTPNGPPITTPRIKLSDGRHLAYKEHGVPKQQATFKFIYVHGFDSCRHHAVVANQLSPSTFKALGIYVVSFDRPGYGESDPNPNRTIKSMALDIEELADQLDLGHKFYVMGFSMGGHAIWSCLHYIPHRLAGATLIAPVVNYWWPGLPANLSSQGLNKQLVRDIWALRVAHYAPSLTYWWNTRTLIPPISVISQLPEVLSPSDKLVLDLFGQREDSTPVRQQGEFESLHRDLNVGFGSWEFDPTDLTNPFPNNEGSVHLWQGEEDILVPVELQRYIAQNLPWIHYHELPAAGHMLPYAKGMSDTIIKAQLSL